MNLQVHFTIGQFLGMTELYEKGLVTAEHFAQQCVAIAKEYKEHNDNLRTY